MTKRSNTVGPRLEIARKTAGSPPPYEAIKKCKDFLITHLKDYIFPPNTKLSDTEYIDRLQIVEKAAKKIARALNTNCLRKEAGISDAAITFKEIMSYKDKRIHELKQLTKGMLDILNKPQ